MPLFDPAGARRSAKGLLSAMAHPPFDRVSSLFLCSDRSPDGLSPLPLSIRQAVCLGEKRRGKKTPTASDLHMYVACRSGGGGGGLCKSAGCGRRRRWRRWVVCSPMPRAAQQSRPPGSLLGCECQDGEARLRGGEKKLEVMEGAGREGKGRRDARVGEEGGAIAQLRCSGSIGIYGMLAC